MMNTSDEISAYDGIFALYEQWCTGDVSYDPSLDFYYNYLRKQPGPFLELGIGTGRIALKVVQECAVDIVGVDVSRLMLNECIRKYEYLKNRNLIRGSLTLQNLSMEDIEYVSEFQTVYLPFRTVGHLMTDQLIDRVFQKVYSALMPGGYFVLDHYMFCREWAEEHNDVDILMYERDGIRITDHYLYDFEKERMECSVKKNGEVIQKFWFRWIKPETIRNTALSVGFHIQNLFGEFDGSTWSADSGNQIWVLRK